MPVKECQKLVSELCMGRNQTMRMASMRESQDSDRFSNTRVQSHALLRVWHFSAFHWLWSCFQPKTDSRWIAFIQALYTLSKRINVLLCMENSHWLSNKPLFHCQIISSPWHAYGHNTISRVSNIENKYRETRCIRWKKITLVEWGTFLWQTKVLRYIWCKFSGQYWAYILVWVEVHGETVGTFRIVRYIVGVPCGGVSIKWGSTVLWQNSMWSLCWLNY